MSDSANIARHLPLMAARQPQHPALKIPRGRTAKGAIDYLTLSFAELDGEVGAWCARLQRAGVQRGDRTLIMVKQGLPLIAAVFALFKLGAVPVVIDPGMGLKSFLRCVARSRPRALVGIPIARIISRVFFRTFASVKTRIAASPSLTARLTASAKRQVSRDPFPVAEVTATDLAAILFTSGSTGAPKGVCYEHGMFEAQVLLIREHYAIQPGEVDLPMLPIFALFNPALGMTTVVPEMDPRRPAEVDPAKIVQAILQEGITNSFGSPTLWRKIQQHCLAHDIQLPSLRRVLCAGAPVPGALWENPARWMPRGTLHSPYGATEALPVSSVAAPEVDLTSVQGACVGRPLPGMQVKIIALVDAPIATLAAAKELPAGQWGEIIVSGPVVTKVYDALPAAIAAAKITDGDLIWHRMGDCGYLDEAGRLWFTGRKIERVQTTTGPMFTEPCEQVFRAHPRVARCALIGLGPIGLQLPAIVVEATVVNSSEARNLARELRKLAREHRHTAAIKVFYFHPKFPVDVRHNAKIHRLTLTQWAETATGYESDPHR
ncbi:MAG: AMP-binding protein [Cephaloticoccus sp.]|nr:AMP-binding protein [Cephaloticoccus sp.]